ncbi:MAG: two-component system response regulator [Vicinamibacteria bacterium]|jgi:DNA-binding response OmpR family regulator
MSEREAVNALVIAADDEHDIVELVRIVLSRAGYEVLTASQGQEALDLARTRVPDLCVLDGVMPGLEGFEVLRALREDERTAAVPVLILTATVTEEREVRRHGVEPDAFMKKPFEAEALLAEVERLLG